MNKQQIEEKIAELQAKLDLLNSIDDDTFNLGTVMVISAANGTKWYIVKKQEEGWQNVRGGNTHSLAEHILGTKNSGVGYFEVYEMKTQPQPFYTSA